MLLKIKIKSLTISPWVSYRINSRIDDDEEEEKVVEEKEELLVEL